MNGCVRRCRFSTGSACGPTHEMQNSSHLRFTSHTGAQLQAKCRDDLQDGVEAWAALSRQGLVEALPGKSGIPCHLGHPLGPCDIPKSLGNEGSISIRLFNACFQVGRHLLRCAEMFGNVVGTGRGFHQVSSVRLSASRRASAMSLACELLSPPAKRMIKVAPLCR